MEVCLEGGSKGGEGGVQDGPTFRKDGGSYQRGHTHDATPVAAARP